MRSKIAAKFCKCEVCPPAEALLSFHRAELSLVKSLEVSNHLSECDFCSAELHLLVSFPPGEETFSPPEMPTALRELAQALLGGARSEFRLLDELVNGKEFLALRTI